VKLNFEDSTLNAMPVAGGKILMSLSEGGMQHLLAGIRCNTAVKAGRYMFELRILESLNPTSDGAGNGRAGPRQTVRLGVSLADSSVFLGDGPSNCCFDSDGFFLHDKSKKRSSQKFVRDQTVAMVLNLDSSSPCANTMSLFVNGKRAGDPVPLPEILVGKPLIPTITYRNVSVEVNFGPTARSNMPFVCRMIGAAATADVEVAKPKAGTAKPEVVFPVGLPDQGYFHWVDQFMEKNPGYTELSDRKILEWAAKSGMLTQRGSAAGSNDKPEARFGIPSMDDWSVSRVIAAIAPTTPRNYVLPELKANLVAADRENALLKFGSQDFKRKAVVMIGDPDQAFKDAVLAKLLEEKKTKVEAEKKRKAAEEERKKQAELRKQKALEVRKAAEEARKKRQRIKSGEDEEMKGEEGEEGKEEEAEGKEEEPKEEAKEEEAKEEEAKQGEDVKMEADAPVELTEEEKSTVFLKTALPDLMERELAISYASFTLPSKAEGFDDITYAWQNEKKCAEHMKAWVMEKKLTNRAEDLTPGPEFKEAYAAWQKKLQEWRKVQQDFKDPSKRKAAAEKKAEEAKKKLEEDKNTMIEAGDEEGAKKLEEEAQAKAAEPAEEVDLENLDVMAVEDILDVGAGEPLFANFTYEDWTLLSTRYELHLLIHSFKKDLNDPDRPSFAMKDLGYYYNKYYRKSWNFQQFGVKEFDDLIDLIKDSVSLESASGHPKADGPVDVDLDSFMKLTEDNRRERQRRIDAGDETARLKFNRPQAPIRPAAAGAGGYGKGGGKGKGSPAPAPSYGQKRPYPAPSSGGSFGAAKQARTNYGGGYGGSPSSAYLRR